ncbi:hypothetical protein JHK85_025252 [Glycine max]|nr:hypothetical protein JHK85_025252 [Glycine max]
MESAFFFPLHFSDLNPIRNTTKFTSRIMERQFDRLLQSSGGTIEGEHPNASKTPTSLFSFRHPLSHSSNASKTPTTNPFPSSSFESQLLIPLGIEPDKVDDSTVLPSSNIVVGPYVGDSQIKDVQFVKSRRLEVNEEVGRGHFGYTCSVRFKKGELKGQQVAVKVIPKAKILNVVAFCHLQGVVHRDLKPEAGKARGCTMTGSILINGKPKSIHCYQKIIGYVPQDDIVHGNLTVEENLHFSARCRRRQDSDHCLPLLEAIIGNNASSRSKLANA